MKTTSLSAGRVRDVGKERAFFISANGYDGFRTRQDSLYRSEDFERVFTILGGPGTGKSSLMRTVADACEQMGAEVTYIYCSSDPASLDGVIITREGKKVALLDGTAPHERGATVPGAIDEIVQLGSFWDAPTLVCNRARILEERRAADAAYERARGYLAVAGRVARAHAGELDRIIEKEKLAAAVTRELRGVRVTNHPFEEVRYLSACGAGGVVHLNTFVKESEVISVTNACGAAHRYLDELRAQLAREGVYGYLRFPSCFDDKITEGIYLPQNKRLYLVDRGEACARKINIKRFISKKNEPVGREHIRRLLRLHDEMVAVAATSFGEAASHHFALEEIYGKTMDFHKKEIFSFLLTKKVFTALGCRGQH